MFVATSESIKQLINYVGQRGRASIFVLLLLDLTGKLFLISSSYHFFQLNPSLALTGASRLMPDCG